MPTTLYLMRHGSTGVKDAFIGSTDLPLAQEAYDQLTRTRKLLATEHIDTIFCSPMQRCRQTADFLQLPSAVTIDDNFREIDFGLWEGKSFSEISAAYPKEVTAWSDMSQQFTFPEGEMISDFHLRVECCKKKIDSCSGTAILVIAHGGILRHLLCSYLGLQYTNYLLFNLHAGKYSALELHSEGGILNSLNSG